MSANKYLNGLALDRLNDNLNGLTLDQLKDARDEITSRINSADKKKKIKIYVVECEFANNHYFLECDLGKAKKELCERIMDDVFLPDELGYDPPKISVKYICESELHKWMELNE